MKINYYISVMCMGLIFILSLIGCSDSPQKKAISASLTGATNADKVIINGANLDNEEETTPDNVNGSFKFYNLKKGKYSLTFIKENYKNKTINISLSKSSKNLGKIYLNPKSDSYLPKVNSIIQKVTLDKARYNPGDNVDVTIDLKNEEKPISGKLYLSIEYLGKKIDRVKINDVNLAFGEKKTVSANWSSPLKDFKGYAVDVRLESVEGKLIDRKATGLDVSSDWTKFPRYGYLGDFGSNANVEEVVSLLNKYHINGLQFYDWQYRHAKPLKGTVANPDDQWKNIINHTIYKSTIDDYINSAHDYNMMAMNYNLLYGAYEDYQTYEKYDVKKEWGLYKDINGQEQDYHYLEGNFWATNKIYLMHPGKQGWQNHIFAEEQKVFDVFNFDGWHVDQLGFRGIRYTYGGSHTNMEQSYVNFLNNAKSSLNKKLVFNAVDEFGQQKVAANTEVDFLYAELWNDYQDYSSLKQVIDNAKEYSNGDKAIVLAAYMNYDLSKSANSGEFNTPGVLLTDAVIFAAGGAHIELGDSGMLSNEYFPHDNLKMSGKLKEKLVEYYDFAVMYQNILRVNDGVSEIDRTITSNDLNLSTTDKKDNVWYFTKSKNNKEVLHLINLLDNNNDWRDTNGDKDEPPVKENFTITYNTSAEIESVKLASPDFREGMLQSLDFERGSGYIEFTIPKLKYWDMVIINKK